MAKAVDIIFCQGGTSPHSHIAFDEGWLPGARSDDTLRGRNKHVIPVMIDWNFTQPNWGRHMTYIKRHRPKYATAPDIYSPDDLSETRDRVAEIAEYADHVIVVPKANGIIDEIMTWPKVILGYSVPTKYGATDVPVWEFAQHPVHLLGGGPKAQLDLSRFMNVISADCKAHFRAAGFGQYYDTSLRSQKITDAQKQDDTGLRSAFRLSCRNILDAWKKDYDVNSQGNHNR